MARKLNLVSTAYGPPWGGIQGTGVTKTGIDLRAHPHQYVVAVDPSVIPLGTKLRIPDNPFGDPNIVFTAADVGGAIKGRRLDFFDWRGRKTQMKWGTRPIEAEIVGSGGKPQRASAGGGGAGGSGATYLPGTAPSGLSGADSGGDLASLLQALSVSQKPPIQSVGLQAPSFAAAPHLPGGYQGVQSGGGPAPKQGLEDVIRQLLPALGGGGIPQARSQGVVIPGARGGGSSGGGGAATGRRGKLLGKPIDRPGVPTNQAILDFAAKVAGVLNSPIQLGTGTAHDQFVKGTTRESAHWQGNALDLPATGDRLTRMGHAALIAAGMPAAQARKVKGGLFNIGGYQIIFNTNEGGNHYNHLHVGLRR